MTIKVRKTKKLPTEPTSGSLPTKRGGWGGPGPRPGSMPQPKVPYRGTGSAVGTAPKAPRGGFKAGGKPPPGIRPLPMPTPFPPKNAQPMSKRGATPRQPTPAELKQKRPLPRAKKR